MRSEVISFLTGEREAQFVASSSDSEVANGTTEEFDIGVAGAEPAKKVRIWSSFIEGRAIRVIWRIQLVLVSLVLRRIKLLWYQAEEDTEYFSHKSIITQSNNCYINFSPTMNFI